MKLAVKIILLLAVAGYLVFAVVKFYHPAEDQVCEAVDIQIQDSLMGGEFISENYVRSVLAKNKISAEGQKISKLDLTQVEKALTDDPSIEKANCYCTAANHLCINVTPQHPVLHVMAANGDDYYLDSNGTTVPATKFNLDLCIATGHISKAYARKHLVKLADYILEDDFWNDQIEQINVVDANNVEIFPRVGDQVILFGNTDNYEDKFHRLMVFYQQGLPKVGWNKYKSINLAFSGQIVCTRAK